MSEMINTMAALYTATMCRNGDAVMESAWAKIRSAAHRRMEADPAEMRRYEQEIALQKRFQ